MLGEQEVKTSERKLKKKKIPLTEKSPTPRVGKKLMSADFLPVNEKVTPQNQQATSLPRLLLADPRHGWWGRVSKGHAMARETADQELGMTDSSKKMEFVIRTSALSMKTLSFKAKREESALGVKSLPTIKKGKSKENAQPRPCTEPKDL